MKLDTALAVLANDPFTAVDLAELSLRLAADEYPHLDVGGYLARLDHLAREVAPRVARARTLDDKVSELAHFLFVEEEFDGNSAAYYDPRNSYLNDVMDRRLGIPLSLSVLAMRVGGGCGLRVVGVGLPGHFVAKAMDADGGQVLFDPFHGGQLLDPPACEGLVTAVTGHPFYATEDSLAATPPGLIVQRMLNNLKAIYLREPDFPRAARVIRRLIQLVPDDITQRRDLGVSLVHAEQPGPAIDHLNAYLAGAPAADDLDVVRGFLKDARKQVARWN
jgi:regulator of sirC expression with transglutaminase-like and TPR domain